MSARFINSAISSQIIADYHSADRRILFLDYDGTLVPFAKYPEMATIDKRTLGIIKKLSNDSKNQVVIISGREKKFLEMQFADMNVNLIAEHGFYCRKGYRDWEATIKTEANWKEAILPIMDEYVNRCNGTFIEEKTGSIAWHYRNADSDFALLRLHELKDDLSEIIRHKSDFEILEGHKVLEVKSGRYDKGQAANAMIANEKYNFILAAGDDKTDEFLFKALPETTCSIRIGLNPSFAKYNVIEISSFLKLLERLAE